MAHKKGGGTTRNGRDSESKRLGVKVYGGQVINAGGIIVLGRRQPGNESYAVSLRRCPKKPCCTLYSEDNISE